MRTVLHTLQRDPARALPQLLERWRENPAPGLAAAIDALGARIPVTEPEDHAHWMERLAAREPADVRALFASAIDGSLPRSKQRLEMLLELPRDPRSTEPLLAWCRSVHLGDWYEQSALFTRVFRLLAHHADPSAIERLVDWRRALQHRANPYRREADELLERIDRLLAKLPSSFEPVDTSALLPAIAALPERLVRTPLPPSDAEAVRARIYDDVDGDGAIEIWADLLEETADPLGTFVRLQLSRPTRARTKQAERLQKQLIVRLLGPLAPVVDPRTARFERGLLHAARVRFATPEHRERLIDHPFWRSVRYVQTPNYHLEHLPHAIGTGLRLLPDPHLHHGFPRGYRYQKTPPPPWGQLGWWARQQPRPLAHVTAALPRQIPSPDQIAVLDGSEGLSQLQTLHLVESMPYGSRWGLDLRGRLGGLVALPFVRAVPHLVLDNLHPSEIPLLDTWTLLRDGPGRLTLFTEHGWVFDLVLDATGFHLDATSSNTWLPRLEELALFVPDASRFASITVRTKPWPTRPLHRMSHILAACDDVKLPREQR